MGGGGGRSPSLGQSKTQGGCKIVPIKILPTSTDLVEVGRILLASVGWGWVMLQNNVTQPQSANFRLLAINFVFFLFLYI